MRISDQIRMAKSVDYGAHFDLLKIKAPKVDKSGSLWVVWVFSPVIRKYVPMSQWAAEEMANKDLAVWKKDHQRVLKALQHEINRASP